MGSPPAEPFMNAKKSEGGSGGGCCTAGGGFGIVGILLGVCIIDGEKEGVVGARCSASRRS